MDSNVLIAIAIAIGVVSLGVAVVLLIMLSRTNARSTAVAAQLSAQLSAQIAGLVPTLTTINDGTSRTSEGIAVLRESTRTEAETLHVPMGKAVQDLRNELTSLREKIEAQQALDAATAESIDHLEMIIAGTKTKGMAGERVIGELIRVLPPDWVVTEYQTNGGVVEFGLRFPSTGLVLPIDSKWPGSGLMDQYLESTDPAEQDRLNRQINAAVISQTREVRKYIDPDRTVNFGVAVVPDAVLRICSPTVHRQASEARIVLVSYSLLVPYLLMVFETVSASAQTIDMVKLSGYLDDAGQSLKSMQGELSGRMQRAMKMLQNSNGYMNTQISKLSSDLIGLQTGAGLPESELLTSTGNIYADDEAVEERDLEPSPV